MSIPTPSSRFMFSPFETNSAELYQSLLRGIETYQQLGNRLAALAEQAHALRQLDRVREYGQILAGLPIKTYQAIGNYFLAVATSSKGRGDRSEAWRLFETVVDAAPDAYKVKAMLSLGALSFHRRDFDSALYFYYGGLKAGKFSASGIHAIRAISVFKAIEGDHLQAINDIENILPAARYAPPHIYLDILNSYAVELGEVGRREEARNVMRHVLASPFAFAYPEWRETAEELKPARRSSVVVAATPDDVPRIADDCANAATVTVAASRDNVLALRGREPDKPAPLSPQPARVLNFIKLKKKMAKKAEEKQAELCLDDMSLQEMWFKLIEIVTEYQATEAQMRAILTFVVNLFSTPPQPDKPSA